MSQLALNFKLMASVPSLPPASFQLTAAVPQTALAL